MKTNELKKGQRVRLANGWEAELADNMRGNVRLARVFGQFTELGSIYAHDIVWYRYKGENDEPLWRNVIHTPAQVKLKGIVNGIQH